MAIIYAIECIKNGKAYVGCTQKIKKRMREHLCLLRNGKHAEPSFQADFNLYSESDFRIFALQEVENTLEQKRGRELYWMGRYDCKGLLYNRNKTSFQPTEKAWKKGQPRATAVEGKKRSPEANLKRRLAQLGIPKGHGAKISATKQAKRTMR